MPLGLRLIKEGKAATFQRKSFQKRVPPFLDQPSTPSGISQPASTLGAGRRILVADDDPVVLKAFELRLKAEGFVMITTAEPANVASVAQIEKADLIVLDVNFPSSGVMEWSGFTVLQWLRRFSEFDAVPVILISAADTTQYRDQALAAGAIALFQKPISCEELLRTILQALRCERQAESPAG